MHTPLTLADIDQAIRPKVYAQRYDAEPFVEGAKLVKLHSSIGEEGDFCELLHLNDQAESKEVPGFRAVQVSRSTQFPGSIKAWHLHFAQDELWYVPQEAHLTVGLWDVRHDSKTKGLTNRLVMGGGTQQLLYIPRGVAHGSANVSSTQLGIIMYFANNTFDPKNPDEHRIPWDALGADFWKPQRD